MAFEPCEECPEDRREVLYGPVYEPGEDATVESKLAATLLHALQFSEPFDWSDR